MTRPGPPADPAPEPVSSNAETSIETEPLIGYPRHSDAEMVDRARAFLETVRGRRTVRDFAPYPVDPAVIEACVAAAATAPNGANRQPWHFVMVTDPGVKSRIREAAEEEERAFYQSRAPSEWLEALAPLGTDEHKPFLETLTHTPSPMGFLNEILGRPENERPFLLLVVGHPAEDARVPRIQKKSLDEILTRV